MRIGTAKTVITPPLPVQLAGHKGKRLGISVADELYSKAIVLEKNDEKICIISNDLLWLGRNQVQRLRDLIFSLTGINQANILVACTHTHSGPDTLNWYDFAPPISEQWINTLLSQISTGAYHASQQLTSCIIRLGYGSLNIAVNRRRKCDGVVYREPNVDGLVDRRLVVLSFCCPDGVNIANLVHTAAHPVILGADSTVISGDWCGLMTAMIEEQLGGNCLFLNGATGDNNPIAWTGREYSEVINVAREAATEVLKTVSKSSLCRVDRVAALRDEALFESHPHPYLKVFQSERNRDDEGIVVEGQIITIGPIRLVGLAGECLVETGDWIRSLCHSSKNCLPVSYANDYIGYLPLQHIYLEGGYEPSATMLTANGVSKYLLLIKKMLDLHR